MMQVGRKITLEIVKEELSIISPDIEVTAKEYKGCNKPLECTCKTCGNVWYPVWDNLKQGKGCMDCRRKKGNSIRRMTIEEIKERVKAISSNLVILDDKYIEEDVEMKCGCSLCGREFLLSWRSMRNGVNCKVCSKEKYFETKRHKISYLKKYLKEHDVPITLLSTKYKNSHANLKFKCSDCDTVFLKTWNNIRSLKQYCPACGIKSRSGVNHPMYDPTITDEERARDRILTYGGKYMDWCREVHKSCNYTCASCRKQSDLIAHHLYSYSTHPDLRLEVSNGRTLCRSCHIEFHGAYGYRNNTPDQFYDYLKRGALNETLQ